MTIEFKYDISNIMRDLNDKDKDNKYDELKIRIEENIKNIKEQILQLYEVSFKNKNEIERLNICLNNLNNINDNFSKITKDIDDYKKVTNDRIEKLFKLIMLIKEKLNLSF